MPITVRELASIPKLWTRVFAGESGLDRQVSWAYVCELPDPTEYLADGELLMTVGYTVPEGPSAQEAYIERLAAGLSGLLVAEKMYAPELSAALASAADRCSLPVLLTPGPRGRRTSPSCATSPPWRPWRSRNSRPTTSVGGAWARSCSPAL